MRVAAFPFLFGGTFIEGASTVRLDSLNPPFPFLFGGTFIEGRDFDALVTIAAFPFLFGGTFIEGWQKSLASYPRKTISLPFRRDFH